MQHIEKATQNTIFSAWARGIGPDTLAATYELSRQQVLEIIAAEKRLRSSPLGKNPRDIIEDYCHQLDALIEELAIVASREAGSARMRAITVRSKVIMRRMEVLAAFGVIPENPVEVRLWSSGVRMADMLLELLEEHGVLTPELMDSMEAYSPSRRPENRDAHE